MVNRLLKTAQGVPPGAESNLNPVQDVGLKLEAIKCLVGVLRSMGDWMSRQMHLTDLSPYLKSFDGDENTSEVIAASMSAVGIEPGEDNVEGSSTSKSRPSEETSEAATFEQQRAYKLEFQVQVPILL
jgi:brefeldin A-inhibited guanine nucleotide-exchange protein